MIELLTIIPIFIALLIMSKNLLSLAYTITAVIFYTVIILLHFHINKYGGEFNITFPDESTYINGTSSLLFSTFVNYFFDTIGPSWFRVMNLLCYNASVILILNRVRSQKDLINWIFLGLLTIGNYWCFFILKESVTVFGMVLIILYLIEKNNIFILFGILVLTLARPDALLLLLFTDILYNQYLISKKRFFIIVIIGLLSVVYLYSLPFSQPIKLSFISRRFEDVYKSYDSETLDASYLSGINFITSKVYIDTIIINFKRAFSYFTNSFGLATLLVSINILGLIVFFCTIRNRKYLKLNLYFLISNLALIMTHNNYRYANAVIIPYLLYYILKRDYESFNNESK